MRPVTQVHILNFPVFGRGLSLRVRADASFNDDRKFLHLQMTKPR